MNPNQQTEQVANVSAPLLKGRVVLVTGASRGIGAATARLLAQHGAVIGVNYHSNQEAAAKVVQDITAEGGKAITVQANVGDEAEVERMHRQVEEALGPIDTLVLNATASQKFTISPFTEITWAQFEDQLIGETKAIFLPAKVALPSMIEHKRGCIVVVSSGLSRSTRSGMSAPSSGKAAVDALARSLAMEFGPHGIRVNTVAPGLVQTDGSATAWQANQSDQNPAAYVQRSTPLGRIALPEDIAGAILMLVSDATGFVTGAYLPVNGGAMMP